MEPSFADSYIIQLQVSVGMPQTTVKRIAELTLPFSECLSQTTAALAADMMAIDLRVRQIALVVFIEKAEATVVDANNHLFAKMRLLRVNRLPQPASHQHPHPQPSRRQEQLA